MFFDDFPECLSGHTVSPSGKKDVFGGLVFEQGGAADLVVTLECFLSFVPDRYHTFLVTLSESKNESQLEVDILKAERNQLGNSEAGGVEYLEHGCVTQTQGCGLVWL